MMNAANITFALTLFSAASLSLFAMPAPPMHLRNTAPEFLVIDVISVKAVSLANEPGASIIEAKVRVVSVNRSASGVQPGQIIAVRYYPPARRSDDDKRIVRGCTTPEGTGLVRGSRFNAYLKLDDHVYYPAASYLSFASPGSF